MARVIKNRNCVMCGQPNVQLWTLDNMQSACAAYLCLEHAAPLQAVMEAAADLAPDEQTPLPERGKEPIPRLYSGRGRRSVEMVPLLDWTPPPPSLPPEPRDEAADVLMVRQARAEGKSWKEIGAALGLSKKAAFEKFASLQDMEPKVAG